MVKKGSLLTMALVITIAIVVYIVSYHTRLLAAHTPQLRIPIQEARARRFGLILDVRSEKERQELGYYPNSIPLSMQRLSDIQSLTTNQAVSILVYSNGDHAAQQAAETLYTMGYQKVRYIAESYSYLMPH